MSQTEFLLDHTTVKGLKELESFLNGCLAKPPVSPFYIFYESQEGNQAAWIRGDMRKEPFQFWYNDIEGRAALKSIKDTIKNVMQAAGKEYQGLMDVHALYLIRKLLATESGEVSQLAENNNKEFRQIELDQHVKNNAWANLKTFQPAYLPEAFQTSDISIGSHRAAFFTPKEKTETTPTTEPTPKLKK